VAKKYKTMAEILYKEESYQIMGILFDVHSNLGGGFSEIVYKDALEYEFKNLSIPYEREKEYAVNYKNVILNHKFYADFVLFDSIILEIKSSENLHPKHYSQCLNYLKVSNNRLAILANFNSKSLEHKRIIR
jgi:GxxExxY protein